MKPDHAKTSYREQLNEENALLLSILDGTSNETGEAFFRVLVKELASVLNTYGALVADYVSETSQLRPRAYWLGDQWVEPEPYDIAGTPCEGVIQGGELFQIPDHVVDHYPRNEFLRDCGLVSYTGMSFKDSEGKVIGHLAVLDSKPVPNEARFMALFEIFGNRAAAEMRRIRAEEELREREERLRRLIDGALDGIIDFDDQLRVHLINPSARQLFQDDRSSDQSASLRDWFTDESIRLIREIMQDLRVSPGHKQAWIGSRLRGLRADGKTFDIEATLSQGTHGESAFHTLILRDVHALRAAEQQILHLQRQADQLRDELAALRERGFIVGESKVFKATLGKALQVAATDATVLLLGETGSGKEVFARAIHESSPRADQPLVTVNCAAIPRDLVESEFFGHVKGAFTGATARRDGRFLCADGGTIFLDEVGELPLDMQAKLLRVLQEGEFEPVGSSKSCRVDVRVIAATHRHLAESVRQGQFREDLFYRLNVFPIEIPPLRDRGEDILLLAERFAERATDRFGRPRKRLNREYAARLRSYHWPGNVRELQNIIEHAVITSRDDWLYPEVALGSTVKSDPSGPSGSDRPIMTADEMRDFHRDNILRALQACHGRIAGERGAAHLLNLKPSTLRSQMKALGIQDQGF
ncbi:MAG TPA: sigma 54-interacting transcriptional regulator [Candidatus Competibacter phosphatis]|nr:sigma 54-interacting transcriptional regulator [Candidatus Competibacter phosphatis]